MTSEITSEHSLQVNTVKRALTEHVLV